MGVFVGVGDRGGEGVNVGAVGRLQDTCCLIAGEVGVAEANGLVGLDGGVEGEQEGACIGIDLGGIDANGCPCGLKREASGVGSGVGKRAVKGEGEEIAFDDGAGELGGLRRGGGIANREGLLRQEVLAVGI